MSNNTYQGILIVVRDGDTKRGFRVETAFVTVNAVNLPPSGMARFGTHGMYAWGYLGAGPSALAHSMLVYEYKDELGQERAEEVFERGNVYNAFKEAVIVPLPGWNGDGLDIQQSGEVIAWTLTSANVRGWVEAHRDEIFQPDQDDDHWLFENTPWQKWGDE